jgi:hypothetical protein
MRKGKRLALAFTSLGAFEALPKAGLDAIAAELAKAAVFLISNRR